MDLTEKLCYVYEEAGKYTILFYAQYRQHNRFCAGIQERNAGDWYMQRMIDMLIQYGKECEKSFQESIY